MFDLKLTAIAAVIGLGVGAGGGWTVKGWKTDSALQKKDAEIAQMVSAHDTAAKAATDRIRAAERGMETQKEQLEHEHQTQIAALEADIAGLRMSRDSLRSEAKRFASRTTASINSKPELSGETASQALDLLADLFTGSEDRAGEIAEFADRAHAAGLMCERQYQSARDALR